jgi:hypothetical protein
LFLSYIDFATVGEFTYAENHDPPITDIKGYIYIDPTSGHLCVRCEDIYVEIKPSVLEAWKDDDFTKIEPYIPKKTG